MTTLDDQGPIPDDFADWLLSRRESLRAAGLLRDRREVTPLPGGRCRINGRTLWNFANNDYLGLSGDPRLTEAASAAIAETGVGARASALVTGRTPWHVQLEERLARFKRAPAALLFPTGYAANVGVLTALAGPGDLLLSDRLNHASLIDGCRLSRARFRVYPHRDVCALRRLLENLKEDRRFIVSDSLFSMDGDLAPLEELLPLAVEFRAIVILDEAHATGVLGSRGSGLLEEFLSDPVDVTDASTRGSSATVSSDPESVGARSSSPTATAKPCVGADRVVAVGTLSKALGVQGGFVTGSKLMCEWLWNSARTQMFSTALAPPLCAAAIAAIDIIENEPQRRHWLREASDRVQRQLREWGWTIPGEVRGPIVPVVIGDPATTMKCAARLEDRGLLIPGIRPPTVPRGTSRLRISLSWAHGEEGIDALLQGFRSLNRNS